MRFRAALPRSSRSLLPTVLAALVAIALPAAGGAATITVDSTADENAATPANGNCTLREAVLAANAGATVDGCTPVPDGSPVITIVVPAGTYLLTLAGSGEDAGATGDLDLAAEITLEGAGEGTTSIDAGGPAGLLDRAVEVLAGGTARLVDLTVEGGVAPAGEHGGGVYNHGTATLLRTTVTDCLAEFGGGVLNDGTLTLDRATLSGNEALVGGGGLSSSAAATATIRDSTLTLNQAERGGAIRNYGTLTVTGSLITDNDADFDGGGLDMTSGTATISGSMLTLNAVEPGDRGGGAVSLRGGELTVSGSLIADSFSDRRGGGVLTSLGSTLTMTDTAILDNESDTSGAGLSIAGTATLERCLVAGNTTDFSGAGIHHSDSLLTLVNTTVSGNTLLPSNAANTAAGIANFDDLVLHHVTLADNVVSDLDPGHHENLYSQFGSEVTAESTVFAGECGVFSGSVISLGGNLESPGDTCTLTDAGDQVSVTSGDLDLQPLADNGGPTLTHALGPASVALGAGVEAGCPADDQRGFRRTDGDCDAGAFELGAVDPDIFADGFESGDTSAWSAAVP